MAVLSKIRQRSIFLIAIIALALFSFVLSDIIKNGGFSNGKAQNTIATVNGIDIPRDEFMEQVDNTQRNMGGASSSSQAMNIVWNSELRRVLYENQYEDLGLQVTEDRLNNELSTNLANNPSFQNEAGVYDQAKVNEYVATIKASSPQMYQQWQDYIKGTRQNILQNTYNNLIKAGLNATNVDGEQQYHFENDKVNIQYVYVPYSKIADDDVSVSDEDIMAYVKAHPSQYEEDPIIDIEYVKIDEEPSQADMDEAREAMAQMLNDRVEFNNVTNANDTISGFQNASNIQEYVNANSDQPYQDRWLFENIFPSDLKDTLFNKPVGTVYGPYKKDNSYRLSKIVDVKQMPDSTEARHILVAWQGLQTAGPDVTRTKEDAEKLADSINSVLKGNRGKFAELAAEFSADTSNKNDGGELGYFTPGAMVPKFNDFVFDNPKGHLGVVETQFGYHIVEVTNQTSPKRAVKLATIVKETQPSETTINETFSKATSFELDAQKGDFAEVAEAQGLETKPVNRIGRMDANIPGIGSNRTIVNWGFDEDTEVGDIKRFNITNGYVIARLTRKSDKKGLMSVAEASATVTPIVRNQKKAAKIRESISGQSLQDVANSQNVDVKSATAVSMASPTIPGAGQEPEVVGAAFGRENNGLTKLIDGKNGVFKVKVVSKTDAPKIDNYVSYVDQLNQQNASASSKVFNALKNKAEIEDNRATFF